MMWPFRVLAAVLLAGHARQATRILRDAPDLATQVEHGQLNITDAYRQLFPTRARARFAAAGYIEVSCNRQRLHSTLGHRTPLEALNGYQAAATAA